MSKNIIPLGTGCGVSYYLKKLQIRKQAFPFDSLWCKNLDNLKHILDNDFEILMDRSQHIHSFPDYKNRIHHKFYDDIFVVNSSTFAHHDILEDSVYQTFQRRIERFKNLKDKENIFITFVSKIFPTNSDISSIKETYKEIVDIMIKKGFTKSKFVLLMIRKKQNDNPEKVVLELETSYCEIYSIAVTNVYDCRDFTDETDNFNVVEFLKNIVDK